MVNLCANRFTASDQEVLSSFAVTYDMLFTQVTEVQNLTLTHNRRHPY